MVKAEGTMVEPSGTRRMIRERSASCLGVTEAAREVLEAPCGWCLRSNGGGIDDIPDNKTCRLETVN